MQMYSILGFAAACMLLAAGCSTPSSRIRSNRAVFDTFSSQVQQQIRNGKIDIGFTKEMVYLAKGDPDRRYSRTTSMGTTEIWSYVGKEYWTDRQRVDVQVRVRDAQGRSRLSSESEYVDVRQEREYERFRIEFVNEKVFSFEELTP